MSRRCRRDDGDSVAGGADRAITPLAPAHEPVTAGTAPLLAGVRRLLQRPAGVVCAQGVGGDGGRVASRQGLGQQTLLCCPSPVGEPVFPREHSIRPGPLHHHRRRPHLWLVQPPQPAPATRGDALPSLAAVHRGRVERQTRQRHPTPDDRHGAPPPLRLPPKAVRELSSR